jgi:hypothetical protein
VLATPCPGVIPSAASSSIVYSEKSRSSVI